MNYMQLAECVRKTDQWIDGLIRWENSHPRYKPFKEDSDSQRLLLMKDDKEIS